MEKLLVYADFDWIKTTTLMGELAYENVRAKDSWCFSFDSQWLSKYGRWCVFGKDLQNYSGLQYTLDGQEIFGCFSDTLPDRWGRTLFKLRERITAFAENRPADNLTSFDYLMGVVDIARIGGFRFAKNSNGDFINTLYGSKLPKLSDLRQLMMASLQIEECLEKNTLPPEKSLIPLLYAGTSVGGARPKTSVVDEKGALTVAKFPSRKDDYDVGGWEHFSHVMASKVGIKAAETRIIPAGRYHVLLSKRFDRSPYGKRIHFASALSLLGLSDGCNASTNNGYPDIVDLILRYGAQPEQDLEELYRRVAFNIVIGNTDDHFRNHGFLLTSKGWVLSPAYDLNPTLNERQSLLINTNTDASDLNILLESSSDYMLTEEKAAKIVQEVKDGMRLWKAQAEALNMPKREIDMFASRIDKWL